MPELTGGICPLCQKQAEQDYIIDIDYHIYLCEECGRFGIHWKLEAGFPDIEPSNPNVRMMLAAYTREKTIKSVNRFQIPLLIKEYPTIDPPKGFAFITLDEAINQFPKTVSERCDRALVNLSRINSMLGELIQVKINDRPLLSALTTKEWTFLDTLLNIQKLIQHEGTKNNIVLYQITAKGWDHISEVEQRGLRIESRKAFVAMSFDPLLFPIWSEGFEPAIKEAGYDPVRIDLTEHNNTITDEIIAAIRKSRFVVADFTGQKQGVYYEAGFALGLGIPVIWTCRKDDLKNCHFDTRQYNHIDWETYTDLKKRLIDRIEATIV